MNQRIRRFCVIVRIAPLVLLVCANSSRAAGPIHRAFTIRNVRIFDGEKIIPANTVTVVNGRNAAVGRSLVWRRPFEAVGRDDVHLHPLFHEDEISRTDEGSLKFLLSLARGSYFG